jgi:hypothetical protein
VEWESGAGAIEVGSADCSMPLYCPALEGSSWLPDSRHGDTGGVRKPDTVLEGWCEGVCVDEVDIGIDIR